MDELRPYMHLSTKELAVQLVNRDRKIEEQSTTIKRLHREARAQEAKLLKKAVIKKTEAALTLYKSQVQIRAGKHAMAKDAGYGLAIKRNKQGHSSCVALIAILGAGDLAGNLKAG